MKKDEEVGRDSVLDIDHLLGVDALASSNAKDGYRPR